VADETVDDAADVKEEFARRSLGEAAPPFERQLDRILNEVASLLAEPCDGCSMTRESAT
jgi:hypothetical protein